MASDEHADRSPYPRVFEPTGAGYPGGVFLIKQDGLRAEGMPIIRKLLAHQDKGWNEFYLGLELWKNPPREYPPMHGGDEAKGIGIHLDLDEAAALCASLAEWIVEESERREAFVPDDMI